MDMDFDELQHTRELLVLCKRRKYELDKQATLLGFSADPHIRLEREDLAQEITRLEHAVARLERQGRTHGQWESDAPDRSGPRDNSGSGLAASVTFLFIALGAVWQREALGAGWAAIGGLCGVCGAFELGLELNRIFQRRNVFDNLGCGLALIILGGTLFHYRYLAEEQLPFTLGLGLAAALALYKVALAVLNAISFKRLP
ncbi:MAG TPA: hypothetical protein VFS21_38295 [Roseiflexaceae bacterium]|nr:hypothetical protein [Roseiflexaceae bacterium]